MDYCENIKKAQKKVRVINFCFALFKSTYKEWPQKKLKILSQST